MPRYLVKHTLHLERQYRPGEFLPDGVSGRTVDKLQNVGWIEPYHTLDELAEQQRIAAVIAAEVEIDSSTSTRHRRGRPAAKQK